MGFKEPVNPPGGAMKVKLSRFITRKVSAEDYNWGRVMLNGKLFIEDCSLLMWGAIFDLRAGGYMNKVLWELSNTYRRHVTLCRLLQIIFIVIKFR